MAISQILIPILTAHIWQTRCGRSNPTPLNSNFTDFDSYSDSSYLADQVWQIYPHPIEWQFHRFWFLFWQLIFGRPGVADLPHVEQQFHRFWFLFWQLIFGRPGVADLPPPIEWQFHRFWFLFWQLIFGRPGVADLPHPIEWQFHRFWFLFWQLIFGNQVWQIYPCRTAISWIFIPIQRAHIWFRCGWSTPMPIEWQFHIFFSYSDSFIFGLPGVADLPPPHRMAISQILIPILTAHIWQIRCGRSTPPNRMAISQILIPILTLHIWLTRCGRSTPTQ